MQTGVSKPPQVESKENADKKVDKKETDVKSQRSLSGASEFSDDAFFDEPVPKTGKAASFR